MAALSRCGANTFCSNNVGSYQCGCNSGLLELWEEHTGFHCQLVHWELGLNAIFFKYLGCADIDECEDSR